MDSSITSVFIGFYLLISLFIFLIMAISDEEPPVILLIFCVPWLSALKLIVIIEDLIFKFRRR